MSEYLDCLSFHREAEAEDIIKEINKLLKIHSDLEFYKKQLEPDDNDHYHLYLLVRRDK